MDSTKKEQLKKVTTIILIIATLGLLVLALRGLMPQKNKQISLPPSPTITPLEKSAIISFEPGAVSATTSSVLSDIILDSQKSLTTGAQLELSFDPKIISGITIKPPVENSSFFGKTTDYIILLNKIDYSKGRISYIIGISPSVKAKKGKGSIGTISFTAVKPQAMKKTSLQFIPPTQITVQGAEGSILQEVVPLEIIFSQ